MKQLRLTLILMSIPFFASAQYFDPNDNLRSVFGGLTFKNPSSTIYYDFLYQMSAHYVDDVYYNPIVNNQSDLSKYFYMYESMYYAAKDTNQWEDPDDYVHRASDFFADTNTLVLFNFDFLDIKDVALNTPGYFLIDTVNNKFLDHPSPIGDPFDVREIFAAAFMNENQQFLNCTYRIDPALMHFDSKNQYKDDDYEGIQLRIDFGDGNGWVYFDQSQVSHHPVTYASAGDYVIQIEFYYQGTTINRAVVGKRIVGDTEHIEPDQTISIIPGIRAGVYNGCADGVQPVEDRKTVIYLEGIDIMDFIKSSNRTVSDIYDGMIKRTELVELRNFGYNFVVVDWVNSRRDMRLNAMSIVALIDYLKCQYEDSDHEFVVIGESMGGLVGRYALTFMETEEYLGGYTVTSATNLISKGPSTFVEPCHPELMHKTRLFMTFDSPHQGANVPLAYQELYNYATNAIFGGKWFSPYVRMFTMDIADLFLGADAAQQMLIYHADSKTGFNTTADEWYYYPHAKKEAFFDDLNAIGNFPNYCKTMALSNGSLEGLRQSRPYNGQLRSANDIFLDFEGDIYARILGIKVKVLGAALEMRSNPNGYGRILETSAGTWGIRVKLYWFGISVNTGLVSSFYHDVKAGNTNPWCTEAGGVFGGNLPDLGGPSVDVNMWPGDEFPLFQNVSSNDGNGSYSFSAEVGIPWVATGGAELELYSDGLHFGFIPVASGLNWGELDNNNPISPDLINEPWPNKVDNSTFDVIAGVHTNNYRPAGPGEPSFNNVYHANRSHLTVLNPIIYPGLTNCFLNSYVLNREIGDEILYLNNRMLVYTSRFEAELDLFVNTGDNNPHYNYATGIGASTPWTDGFYSKNDPFIIDAQPYYGTPGIGVFKYDNQFIYNTPTASPSQVFKIQQPLWICCHPASSYKVSNITPNTEDENRNSLDLALSVSPNPTSDQIVVSLVGDVYLVKSYQLISIDGKIVVSGTIDSETDLKLILDLTESAHGMYSVVFYDMNDRSLLSERIIKK